MYIQIRVGVGYSSFEELMGVDIDMCMYYDEKPLDGEYGYNVSVKSLLTSKVNKNNRFLKLLIEKEKQLISKFENSFKEDKDRWEKVFKGSPFMKTKLNVYDTAYDAFTGEELDKWLTEMFDGLFLEIYTNIE